MPLPLALPSKNDAPPSEPVPRRTDRYAIVSSVPSRPNGGFADAELRPILPAAASSSLPINSKLWAASSAASATVRNPLAAFGGEAPNETTDAARMEPWRDMPPENPRPEGRGRSASTVMVGRRSRSLASGFFAAVLPTPPPRCCAFFSFVFFFLFAKASFSDKEGTFAGRWCEWLLLLLETAKKPGSKPVSPACSSVLASEAPPEEAPEEDEDDEVEEEDSRRSLPVLSSASPSPPKEFGSGTIWRRCSLSLSSASSTDEAPQTSHLFIKERRAISFAISGGASVARRASRRRIGGGADPMSRLVPPLVVVPPAFSAADDEASNEGEGARRGRAVSGTSTALPRRWPPPLNGPVPEVDES